MNTVKINELHHVPEFKRLLVLYYEDRDKGELREFVKTECIRKI